MKSLKKKIVAGLIVAMCFAPCFSENICESAESMTFHEEQVNINGSSEVRELLRNVEKAERKRDALKAFAYAEEGIKRYPNLAYFYYLRAGLCQHYDIKKRSEMVQNLDKAIELDPNFANAYILRAEFFAQEKQYDKAIADYNRAIELEPARAYPYRTRAAIYAVLGEKDRALADYSRVIELEPDFATTEYFRRANLYYSEGKYDEAIKDCDMLINWAKEFTDSKDTKALEDKLGKYGKKSHLTMSEMMFILFPGQREAVGRLFDLMGRVMCFPDVYVLRGKAYYEQGKYQEALADGEKAMALNKQAMGAQRLVDLAKRALEQH